jgi:LEA14-like dessication related protein
MVYAAGAGIAAAAVAIFFLMGQGPVIPSGSPQQPTVDPPVVSIKDIKVSQVDDRNAKVEVVFSVKNPNRTTLVLETIHYEVHVDNVRMTIGDVGQSPEGFLASQSDIFTIVSGTTLTVSDEQTAVRTTMSADAWDTMVGGGATYTVTGTNMYRVTLGNLQTTAGEQDFALTFP